MTATKYPLEHVILVDNQDREIGTAEKISAHQQNLLHRAFSVFVFRGHGVTQELLLQQRAANKYHSPGLWTNTCCSHPRMGETVLAAANRRLQEELGINTTLENLGWFHYNWHFQNGLSENEIDYVLVGHIDPNTIIQPNPQEVGNYRWITIAELKLELATHPAHFTPWLPLALDKLVASPAFIS